MSKVSNKARHESIWEWIMWQRRIKNIKEPSEVAEITKGIIERKIK